MHRGGGEACGGGGTQRCQRLPVTRRGRWRRQRGRAATSREAKRSRRTNGRNSTTAAPFRPTGAACDDGSACTAPDRCDGAGTCAGDIPATVPTAPSPLAPANGSLSGSPFAAPGLAALRSRLRREWTEDGCPEPTFGVRVDDGCAADGLADSGFESPESEATGIVGREWRPPSVPRIATAPPVGRRHVCRARACRGASCSAWSGVRYLDVDRVFADFNGDGFSTSRRGRPEEAAVMNGAVYVLEGSPSGIVLDPRLRPTSPSPSEEADSAPRGSPTTRVESDAAGVVSTYGATE